MNKKIQQVKKVVKQSEPIQKVQTWYSRATLPGFEGIPIQKVVKVFVKELQKDKIGPRASAVSFNFLLAFFPFMIFLFSLIPVIPINGLQEEIFELLKSVLPEEAFLLARETIEETISKKRVDLLSFGFLAMILFSTNGVNAMLKTFSKINPAFKARSFLREYGVALILTLMLSILFVLSISLAIFGSYLIRLLLEKLSVANSDLLFYLLLSFKWLFIILIYFFAISLIYYFGPALKTKWKFISLGGTVATILSISASLGFGLYVNQFGQYNKLYGSIGTVMMIMVWMYINSLVLMLGFELNNSIRLFELTKDIEDEEDNFKFI